MVDEASHVCPSCAGTLHSIGEDVSERLDVVPAQFWVLVVCRPKHASRTCSDVVVQASALDPRCGRTRTGRAFVYARDDRLWGSNPPMVAFVYDAVCKASVWSTTCVSSPASCSLLRATSRLLHQYACALSAPALGVEL